MVKNIQNIVIVGSDDDNAAKFSTNVQPIKLNVEMEMAITSIYHGEIHNITENNNKVFFVESTDELPIPDNPVSYSSWARGNVIIKPGRYKNVLAILKAINIAIKERVTNKSHRLKSISDQAVNITITSTGIDFLVYEDDKSPWNMIGVNSHITSGVDIIVSNEDFDGCSEPGFLYASIIENSYINGRLSRMLGVIPLNCNSGWSFHEFNYPNYVPITVKEFSNITLEIRDLDGQYIKFNPSYKTVISLSIRAINRPEF